MRQISNTWGMFGEKKKGLLKDNTEARMKWCSGI